jgi:gliding motility-associated-like protein
MNWIPRLLTLILFQAIALSGFAQVDTEFWFAPPEVTSGHGDSPIYIRLSTLDKPAVISITQPALGNTVIAHITINANQTQTVDLTSRKNSIEGTGPGFVRQTGIRIVSSAPITAYYEVGAQWNSDIFALKGKNALGNNFVIPAQNFYNNSPIYSPLAFSTFDIVATQNNTVVKIRPTKRLRNHENDSVIIVKLNAGETYSLQKTSQLASDNPGGTVVESTKPIAVTLKDDSVTNGGCHDLLGDQLVPIEVTGSEYIVLKGFLQNQEYLFITAIFDDTEIYVNGSSTATTKLKQGEVFRFPVTTASTYLRGTKSFYVMHVTGFGCEMGMAVLPSINCKGSTQIGFARTTSEFFGLNILVRKQGIHGFQLNGSTTLVPSSAFSPVPGTNDTWYTAQLSFTSQQIPVGQGSLISNAQNSFQIGIINGDAATTCKYGYFSAFSTLFIGDDFAMCEGETMVIDAGAGKESYSWSTGQSSQTITVDKPGKYWVESKREDCILRDTITVTVKQGKVEIEPVVEICPGEKTKVNGKENFSWKWSDGSTRQYLETTLPGTYWVEVSDYTGCRASDTVLVVMKATAPVDLGSNRVKCKQDEINLNAYYPQATYLWSDGKTSAQNAIVDPGLHWVKVSLNGCTSSDSITIINHPGPVQDTIYGSPSVCPGVENVVYETESVLSSQYKWFVFGGTIASQNSNRVTVNWQETNNKAAVSLLIKDSIGCLSDTLKFPVRVNPQLIAEIPEGPGKICLNKAEAVTYSTPITNGSVYQWSISGGEIMTGQGTSRVIVRWDEGNNKLWIKETSETSQAVCEGTSPVLDVIVFRDSSAIFLHAVSVDTTSGSDVVVNWASRNLSNPVTLHINQKESGSDQVLITSEHMPYVDKEKHTQHTFFDCQLSFTNSCDEQLVTSTHRTMLLMASSDTLSGMLSFSWNAYSGWREGVGRYELWRRLDDSPGYQSVKALPADQTNSLDSLINDGFLHTYVVRAVQLNGTYDSWSNPVTFEFEHPITIPNVITPNNDGLNDYFVIPKITIYKKSRLVIVDRWGKKVYEASGYQNNWNGDELASGVYYYSLVLNRNNQTFRGPITIMR